MRVAACKAQRVRTTKEYISSRQERVSPVSVMHMCCLATEVYSGSECSGLSTLGCAPAVVGFPVAWGRCGEHWRLRGGCGLYDRGVHLELPALTKVARNLYSKTRDVAVAP
jgi:hypothetical protein